jgi:hypothetical protein
MWAVVAYLYTGTLSYEVDTLPISEAHFLTSLYRTAVNRALGGLADLVYSQMSRPETQIGRVRDIQQILHIILFYAMGKGKVGLRRRTEIRQAMIVRFAEEIWDIFPDEDLEQLCGDNEAFAREMLEAVADVVCACMAERGVDLEELD